MIDQIGTLSANGSLRKDAENRPGMTKKERSTTSTEVESGKLKQSVACSAHTHQKGEKRNLSGQAGKHTCGKQALERGNLSLTLKPKGRRKGGGGV